MKTQENAMRAMRRILAGAATIGLSVLVSGCGIGAAVSNDVNTYSSEATIHGSLYGGQQPVAFATVQLWSAGTTGYGSAGTLLATTTTSDPDGAFSFVKSATNGTSSGSGNTWACPSTSDDPQLYLISSGGNSLGNHINDSANTNSAIVLMAALGACSTVSNSTFVIVNEVSTVAAAFALAPYMNATGATAGSELIGTNGSNVSTSTPQAAVGLNNAVAGVANLMTASTIHSGSSASTSTVQITATPEAGKVNTMADILAACVNTQTSASAACAQLFAGALSTTGAKPVDTLQAAYYMATNPTGAGTFTSCGTGPTTNIGCLFNLAASTSPFQPTIATAPTDWTIGVTYKMTAGGCSSNGFGGAGYFDVPTRAAVDAEGNIFIVNGSVSKAAIVELSPIGVPVACVVPNAQSGTAQTYGQNITIDPSGNVWAAYSHGTLTNAIAEWPAGTSTPLGYTPAAQVYGITSDLDGNVFYTSSAAGSSLYEFVAPTVGTLSLSTATSVAAASSFYAGGSSSAIQLNNLQTDTVGRVFGITGSVSSMLSAYPLSAAITAYTVSSGAVTFTATNSFVVGQTVTISGLTAGTQFNGQRIVLTAANGTSFTGAVSTADVATTSDSGAARATGAGAYTTANTGLASASYGLAIGASNTIFTGTACCTNSSTAIAKAERFVPAATAVAGAGSSSAQYLGGLNGTRAVAVDGAGVMWMGEYWPETSAGVYGLVAVNPTVSGTTVTYKAVSPVGAAPSTACSSAAGCPTGGGFQKADMQATMDVVVDPSGNVWVLNTGTNTSGTIGTNGASVTEFVGAATPIVTPLSVAARTGALGARP
ncbi:MAG: hypothetical protein PW792_14425 [Acidobacteriaceae bacterium]|nr:hypothetical protein [Acidobacteriaceae bacterium]